MPLPPKLVMLFVIRISVEALSSAIGYSLPTGWGTWDTLASVSRSHVTDIRAFLHPELTGAADTQNQDRLVLDHYFDTHLGAHIGSATLLVGADLLYGYGKQTTANGNSAYTVPLDGSVVPPPTTRLPIGWRISRRMPRRRRWRFQLVCKISS